MHIKSDFINFTFQLLKRIDKQSKAKQTKKQKTKLACPAYVSLLKKEFKLNVDCFLLDEELGCSGFESFWNMYCKDLFVYYGHKITTLFWEEFSLYG